MARARAATAAGPADPDLHRDRPRRAPVPAGRRVRRPRHRVLSDTGANVVATLAGGATTAVAGIAVGLRRARTGGQAAAASVYHPGGSAEDAKGDVFIADSGDNMVREVTPAGVISRIAGSGIAARPPGPGGFPANPGARLDHPQNVAVNAAGDVYVGRHLQQPGRRSHPARDS